MSAATPTTATRPTASQVAASVAADLTAASIASLAISPFITAIDVSIFTSASSGMTMKQAVMHEAKQMVRQPMKYFKSASFAWVWGLYAATYAAANLSSTFLPMLDLDRKTQDNTKFAITALVNVPACVLKDRHFTRAFSGGTGIIRPIRVPTYTLYAARDSLTVFSSFVLPPIISQMLQDRTGMEAKYAKFSAQILSPVSMQVIAAPLQSWGADIYMRPDVSGGDRARMVAARYAGTTALRMSRKLPAFGVGGVINTEMRAAAACARLD
ncbi:hypothetical protein BDK51DRAFT_48604 [Blyttiomyces helicus]|uniref:Mitochondrial carrier domain-containing protein n=1 Tax=Blyttiomyces helicus TaxID=388810 RepID=A0A4P9W164_9FUNG|nr:hypothetical protein BDK51DRAFT_48604 [Blyttiomyces helicus]|eukprot:RKO84883.1 hypothetical protein BDK51DRAFT_48604 [Blyttiomyces helicus]